MSYISFDSSTSSTTVLVFNEKLEIVKRFQKEHKQIYTPEGYIEHDLEEIYQNLITLIREASNINNNPDFISITNQRETFTVFDKKTGKSLHNAVVWQCTRGQAFCDELLKDNNKLQEIITRTGLKPNTFFSASKLKWLLDNKPEIKEKLLNGDALFGTIDCYLLYRLTQTRSYLTDTTNASRTLLFNCVQNEWDEKLLSIFKVSGIPLPKVKESADCFGESDFEEAFNKSIPIIGVIGDAQASMFANLCFNKGDSKITTGTGFNIQTNIGDKLLIDKNSFTSLSLTRNNNNQYAFECLNAFAGATISWLKNNLGVIHKYEESETLSLEVESNGGVYLIPAFSGLGPPYWLSTARAMYYGISASTNKKHIVRASLESVAYQMVVYLETLKKSQQLKLNQIIVDGGMIKNNFFLQIIADLLEIELQIPQFEDMSAYGALLSGLTYSKNIQNLNDLNEFAVPQKKISPTKNDLIQDSYGNWKSIIEEHFLKKNPKS